MMVFILMIRLNGEAQVFAVYNDEDKAIRERDTCRAKAWIVTARVE